MFCSIPVLTTAECKTHIFVHEAANTRPSAVFVDVQKFNGEKKNEGSEFCP